MWAGPGCYTTGTLAGIGGAQQESSCNSSERPTVSRQGRGRDHRIGSRVSGWRAGGKEARTEQRLPLAFSSLSLRRLGGPSISVSVCVSVSTGEAQTAQAHEAQKIAAARLCLRLCLCPVPGALSGPQIAASAIRRFRMPEKQAPSHTRQWTAAAVQCAACIGMCCASTGRQAAGRRPRPLWPLLRPALGAPTVCDVRPGSASRSNQHGAASVA